MIENPTNMIDRDTTIVASPDQVSSALMEEAVILNLKDGVYYGLDPVGARIWTLIQSPLSVAELCGRIVDEYEVDEGECEADILALLNDMAEKGLVRVEVSEEKA
jgi:hypothetical protein